MGFNQDKHIGMTMVELADYLRVSLSTVKRGTKSGDIPHFKVGKKPRYDKAEVDKVIKGNRPINEIGGIYKPKKDPKKPDGPDKNGSGGGDHGQSL